MKLEIKKAAEFLKSNDNFCFLCHKNLDGDTFGACYGLKIALKQLGKKGIVKTYKNEVVEKFFTVCDIAKQEKEDYFNIMHYIAVDVASLNLLEETFEKKKISLCIDHHKTNKIFANLKCVIKDAAATCEIIYLILKELNLEITKIIANCLYLGIASDCGCFKYENTTATTHKIAAELIEKGADFSRINFEIFDLKTKKMLNLQGEILKNLEFYFKGAVIIVFITKSTIEKFQLSKDDSSFVAGFIACVEDVLVAPQGKAFVCNPL